MLPPHARRRARDIRATHHRARAADKSVRPADHPALAANAPLSTTNARPRAWSEPVIGLAGTISLAIDLAPGAAKHIQVAREFISAADREFIGADASSTRTDHRTLSTFRPMRRPDAQACDADALANLFERSFYLLTLDSANGVHRRRRDFAAMRRNSLSLNTLRAVCANSALAFRAHAHIVYVRIPEGPIKRPKNLLLDVHALNAAEAFCQAHGTNLSLLVSDFLRTLPALYQSRPAKSPIVARLRGAATEAPFSTDEYREYLWARGRRKRDDDDY